MKEKKLKVVIVNPEAIEEAKIKFTNLVMEAYKDKLFTASREEEQDKNKIAEMLEIEM